MSRADVELLGPVTVRAIVSEMVRVELARILASEQDAAPRSGDEAEAAIEEIERDLQRLRKSGRRREYDLIRDRVDQAVERLRLPPLEAGRIQVDRPAHAALVQAREVELAVEEGEPAASAAATMLADRFGGAELTELRAPALISEVVASKAAVATPDMKRKFEGVGRLLVAHFGDVPLNTLDDEKMLNFLLWYRRLPKIHGRSHGRKPVQVRREGRGPSCGNRGGRRGG